MILATTEVNLVIRNARLAENTRNITELITSLKPVWNLEDDIDLSGFTPEIRGRLLRRIGFCLVLIGRKQNQREKKAQGRQYLKEAILLLQAPEERAEAESVLASAYLYEGRTEKALRLIEKAGENLKVDSTAFFYNQTNKMCILSWLGEHEEAKSIFWQISDSVESSRDDYLRAFFLCKVGGIFWFSKEFDTSLIYCRKAFKISKRIDYNHLAAACLNNIAGIYCENGDFANAHTTVRQSFELFRQFDEIDGLGHVLDTEAQIYFAEGKLDNAKEVIELAIDNFKNAGAFAGQADSMLLKIRILKSSGELSKALQLNEELRKFVYKNLGVAAYDKFHEPLNALLGENEVEDNKAIPADSEF